MIRILLAALFLTLLPMEPAMTTEPAEKGIIMVGEMIAKPGKGADLHARMQKEIPPIATTKGLKLYEVLRSEQNPDKIVIVEVWDSAEDHAAAVKEIDPDSIREVKALMASMSGETFKR